MRQQSEQINNYRMKIGAKNYPLIIFLLICLTQTSVTAQNLPNTLWRVVAASSEELNQDQPNCRKELIIDGNTSTFWHSKFSKNKKLNPHEIEIDLGAKAKLVGVTLVPRQRNSSGKCTLFEISISTDHKVWKLCKKGEFHWAGNNDFTEKNIDLNGSGRYIKYRHLKTYDNGISDTAVAALAELKVQGMYIEPIIVADFTIQNLPKEVLVGTSLDCVSTVRAYNSKITNYHWICQGAEIISPTASNCKIIFETPGFYSISLQVKNDKGHESTKKYGAQIRVQPAPKIENRSLKVDTCSDQDAEYKHAAINTIDEFENTYWQTSWDQLVPLPHFIVYDLGALTSISGIGYLPLQFTNEGLIKSFSVFVSNDGKEWGNPIVVKTIQHPQRLEQLVAFQPINARYLKFQIDKTIDAGSNFVAFSKFYVYGEFVNPLSKYLGIGIIVSIVFLSFLFLLKWRQKKRRIQLTQAPQAIITEPKNKVTHTDYSTYIYVFGGFKIIHNGEDITTTLSPKLRQLFVLMSYYPEGISIHKLGELLWPGMPTENLTNTRGTNIQRLKTALKGIHGINLIYNQKNWSVQLDQTVYFDLKHYKELSESINNQFSITSVREICSILRSPLLIDINEEWVDPIKEKISNDIIDVFQLLITNPIIKKDSLALLDVVDVLLVVDELNENALEIKIKILISQNKQSLAKLTFDNFVKKYRLIYNEEFNSNFASFAKGKN